LPEGVFKSYLEMQIPRVTTSKFVKITVPSDAPPEFVRKLKAAGYKVEVELTEEDRVMEELARKLGRS
jgi:hypothetical protein